MDLLNILPEDLKRLAIVFDDYGFMRAIWRYSDILKVIDYVAEYQYAVLGGDVYAYDKQKRRYTLGFDNWYLNRGLEQPWEEYVAESRMQARNYLEMYYQRNGDDFYYDITIQNEIRYNSMRERKKC